MNDYELDNDYLYETLRFQDLLQLFSKNIV